MIMSIIMSITTTIVIISPIVIRYPACVTSSLLFPQPLLLSTSLLKSIFLRGGQKEKITKLRSISLPVCVSRSPCSVLVPWNCVLGTELCAVGGSYESLRGSHPLMRIPTEQIPSKLPNYFAFLPLGFFHYFLPAHPNF